MMKFWAIPEDIFLLVKGLAVKGRLSSSMNSEPFGASSLLFDP